MKQITIGIPTAPEVRKAFYKVALIGLCLYVIFIVREIWVPLGLAFLVAMILDPVVDRMEARGWKRPAASAFIFVSFVLILIGSIALVTPYFVNQMDLLQKGFERYFPDSSSAGIQKSLIHLGLTPSAAKVGYSLIESSQASLQHSTSSLTGFGVSALSNSLWLVIIPIVAFYALRDFHILLGKCLLLVPSGHRESVQNGVRDVTTVFGRYLRGLGIVSCLNGIATAILLGVIGVPGALVLGVLAGILYSVPYIGAFITIVITAAVAFIGGGPNMLMLAVGSSVVLHQVVFDQIVSPKILGGHVGLHPIISIVALLIGNLLLGVVGMVLAVPVAACIQMGVVAWKPKLSQEIELPDSAELHEAAALDAAERNESEPSDPTGDIHRAVAVAVEQIDS